MCTCIYRRGYLFQLSTEISLSPIHIAVFVENRICGWGYSTTEVLGRICNSSVEKAEERETVIPVRAFHLQFLHGIFNFAYEQDSIFWIQFFGLFYLLLDTDFFSPPKKKSDLFNLANLSNSAKVCSTVKIVQKFLKF
jgi:hypothetical protein